MLPCESSRQSKRHCDSWIEVSSADVAKRINHGGNNQPERQRDAGMTNGLVGQLVHDNGPCACENDAESAQGFGQ